MSKPGCLVTGEGMMSSSRRKGASRLFMNVPSYRLERSHGKHGAKWLYVP